MHIYRLSRRLPAAVAVLLYAGSLQGEELYVSPTGAADGDGSFEHPWNIDTLFKGPSSLRPGDTVYLRGGIYAAGDRLLYRSRVAGEPEKYITVRPYKREHVRIDGGLEIHGPWTVFRDLEIANSRTTRVAKETGSFPSEILQPIGIVVFAPNVKIVNNVVRDNSSGMASWKEASNGEFYGNIIFNNGWMGPDRAHGHGAYMQNQFGSKMLIDNVVFNQFDLGMQIYGTSNAFLNNFYLEGNIVFNNGSLGGRYSRNLLLGGTVVAEKPVLKQNFTYYPTDRDHGGENNIGYYPFGAGCTDLQMEDNFFISGSLALSLYKCSAISVKGNTLMGGTRSFSPSDHPANKYLRVSDRPKGAQVFVRPNRWEPGRAHVVIYNWDRAGTVAVDLSGIRLEKGDLFEVRDVQDLFGRPIFSGVYQGKAIDFAMTGTRVTEPVGSVPIRAEHSDREFGVFLVRKTGSASSASARNIHIEAESAALTGPARMNADRYGSAGCAVISEGEDSGAMEFSVDVPEEDEYAIWLRVKTASPPVQPLSLKVDEGAEEPLEILEVDTQWRWVRVNAAGDALTSPLDVRIVKFTEGPHKLTLRTLAQDVSVDAVFLTNDLYAAPSEPVIDAAQTCPEWSLVADAGTPPEFPN